MKQKLLSLVLILAVLIGQFAGSSNVQHVKASSPECYVRQSAVGANNGSDWANAFTDLQSALSPDAGCTIIRVAAGDYNPDPGNNYFASFTLRSGMQVLGGYPPGGGDDSSREPAIYQTILNGSLAGHENYVEDSMHVVSADGTDSTTILDGFTITNGYALGDAAQYGGGITITEGSPILRNLVIMNNSTNGGGAGIYLLGSSPTITNVQFTGNGGPAGSNLKGGGLYNAGDWFYDPGSPILTHVTFSSNTVDNGGGMYSDGGNPQLIDVIFQSNQAVSDGGGLYIDGGNLSLSDSHFDGNNASNGAGIFVNGGNLDMRNTQVTNGLVGGSGGGIFIASSGSISIKGGSINTNHAYAQGGGIYSEGSISMIGTTLNGNNGEAGGGGIELVNTTTADFVNLTIDSNQTITGGFGGGIRTDNATATFTNLLLTHNSAWQGGGMSLENSDISLENATIVQNDSTHPGTAIHNDNLLTIANTIVYAHFGTSIDAATTVSDSFLQDDCPAGAICTGVSTVDPKFADPQMISFRLSPTSPAVDAGDLLVLPPDTYDLDGDGNQTESLPIDLDGKTRVVLGRVDAGAYEAQVWNSNWTQAVELPLIYDGPDQVSGSIDRYLDLPGQSRWFKFAIQPSSKVIVTLTGLPANYDLALYKNISEAYSELYNSQDLLKLSAEFAPDTFSPDTFSPDTFSPDTFSPDTFSPDTFSPDTFSPDTFSPDTFSPDTFSPDTFSPDTFSPDTFSPDTFSPDTFSPDTFSPDTFSPDTFSPDTFSPDTFSSVQTRSLIAVSAHDGLQGEGIIVNTWTKTGYFYVRVRGRNGAYNYDNPFHLTVIMLSGTCSGVSPVLPGSDTTLTADGSHTLLMTNMDKIEGTQGEKDLVQSNLDALAARTNGQVVEVGGDTRVNAASQQAQSYPACVYAMNLQAEAIKGIMDRFRELNPDLEYIVLVGNDHAFPFFRYSDSALLASEIDYSPPVLDNTTSQASLKAGYILSQDTYGSAGTVSYKAGEFPIPDLAVGRLVETAADMNKQLDAYLGTTDGIVTASNALVTGYDFLADDADAVAAELRKGMDPSGAVQSNVDTLISPKTLAPVNSWTADQLRQSFLGSRHDINFLAGHFSATSALAADYQTRMTSEEVLNSSTDLTNSLVYSAGCHSGYNIVNADDVPGVTEEPDWPQVFAAKGATFIGGTGYQYGDTDFIEYSERLYLEFTRQLRYGSGPVAVGKALVQAKQAYLAATPVMRGIHEKSLLEATLFGLPMLQVNITEGRGDLPPADESVVTATTLVPPISGIHVPGNELGLRYYDLSEDTPTTLKSKKLDQTNPDGSLIEVDAYYLEGKSGIVVNPAEPVLPLDMINVTSPDAGYVLRGVAWRGGTFSDRTNILPLTGAATEDLRAPHVPFYSDVFYPIRPWNVNYYDALGSSDGATRLALMPAQYRSSTPGSTTGNLRAFSHMDFRLFYSNNIDSYTNLDPANNGWTNTPALAAPPDISHIASFIPTGTMALTGNIVNFEIQVTGDPSAGIQAVWIVYSLDCGNSSGTWQSLDLQQDSLDSRLWKGSLDLGSASTEDLCFVVQAVNGVGLGTLMTNQGAGYLFGQDPGALPQGQSPLTLEFDSPASDAPYGSQQSFTVIAKNKDGNTVDGLTITFNLGGMGRLAATGNGGKAEANFYLAMEPGNYTLEAAFAGNDTYAPAVASTEFRILPGTSALVLDPKTKTASPGSLVQFTATLKSGNVPLSGKNVALTYADGSGTQIADLAVTDYAGRATWSVKTPTTGSLNLSALFGQRVSDMLNLSNPYYAESSDTAKLTAGSGWISINNIPAGANYGGSFKAAFTGSYGGNPWVTSSTNAICTVGTDKLTVNFVGVGTCTLRAHAPGDGSASAAEGSDQGFSIAKAALTVTADDKSAQYSDANPPLTFHYSGLQWSDPSSVIDTPPTCSTTRKVGDLAGVYNDAVTCSGGADGNYFLSLRQWQFHGDTGRRLPGISGDRWPRSIRT